MVNYLSLLVANCFQCMNSVNMPNLRQNAGTRKTQTEGGVGNKKQSKALGVGVGEGEGEGEGEAKTVCWAGEGRWKSCQRTNLKCENFCQ